MIAPWPQADVARQNAEIEARFARFQEVLRAVRDIRDRQKVPEADADRFRRPLRRGHGRVAQADGALLRFHGRVRGDRWGPEVVPPKLSANVALAGMEVFVDLADLIDVGAEVERKKQEMVRLEGLIAAKRKKLENANFVQRAPAAVVEGERAALKDLEDQLAAARAVVERMKGT